MTTGAEKLWNQLHDVTPPKRTPPDSVLSSPDRPPNPMNSPLALQVQTAIAAIDTAGESTTQPKEEPKMKKFWTIYLSKTSEYCTFNSKEEAITNARIIQAEDKDNTPIYIMEAVAVAVRPIVPKVEITDL